MSTTIHTASDAGPDPHATLSADWSDGYRVGCEHGYRAGYIAAERDMARAWAEFAKPTAARLARGVGLGIRRWGPGGRARFGDERPGDFPGREVPDA